MSSGIHTPKQRRRHASAATVLVLAFAAALVGLVASPASAHDELIGTDPASGSTLTTYPTEITLTFNDIVLDEGNATQLKVTDAGGTFDLADGRPTVQDNVVTQKLTWPQADAAILSVKVLWRVVSRDGHPVSGEFSFRIAPGSSPSPTPTAAGTSVPATSAPPAPSASATAPTSPGGAGPSPAPWIILGALTVAALAAATYLLVSRARRPEPPADAADPESGGDSER